VARVAAAAAAFSTTDPFSTIVQNARPFYP
jgi:hypothetical protein